MDRSRTIARKARLWKLIGVLAFVLGAFMLYQKVTYEIHDFYGEYYEVYQDSMNGIQLSPSDRLLLNKAMDSMQSEAYWEAITSLESLKQENRDATQIAEWYKILCMIGLDRKEDARSLLDYYSEQADFDFNRERAVQLMKTY